MRLRVAQVRSFAGKEARRCDGVILNRDSYSLFPVIPVVGCEKVDKISILLRADGLSDGPIF